MKEALTSAGLTLHNRRGITIGLHPLGATWTSCRLPLPDQVREVLLGSRDVVAMLLEGGSYLGASVGRYAGRIAQARFGDHVLDANTRNTRWWSMPIPARRSRRGPTG